MGHPHSSLDHTMHWLAMLKPANHVITSLSSSCNFSNVLARRPPQQIASTGCTQGPNQWPATCSQAGWMAVGEPDVRLQRQIVCREEWPAHRYTSDICSFPHIWLMLGFFCVCALILCFNLRNAGWVRQCPVNERLWLHVEGQGAHVRNTVLPRVPVLSPHQSLRNYCWSVWAEPKYHFARSSPQKSKSVSQFKAQSGEQ